MTENSKLRLVQPQPKAVLELDPDEILIIFNGLKVVIGQAIPVNYVYKAIALMETVRPLIEQITAQQPPQSIPPPPDEEPPVPANDQVN